MSMFVRRINVARLYASDHRSVVWRVPLTAVPDRSRRAALRARVSNHQCLTDAGVNQVSSWLNGGWPTNGFLSHVAVGRSQQS